MRIALIGLTFTFVTLASLIGWNIYFLPDATTIKGCLTASMNQVRLCPGSKDYAPLNQISDNLISAVIVTEDASFYSHKGFDWAEIKKSIETNLDRGHFARGGSTITQQLAKNVYLNKDKNLLRKLKEAILAQQIEKILSKSEILERYLNVVEFGEGIYGVKQAAQHYFFKSPSELNLLEAAYLTHLLPNPKVYSQTFQRGALTDFSRKRVIDINRTLRRYNKIKESQLKFVMELVDRFPWHDLTENQIAHLEGWADDTKSEESTEEISATEEEMVDSTEEENMAPPEESAEPFDD